MHILSVNPLSSRQVHLVGISLLPGRERSCLRCTDSNSHKFCASSVTQTATNEVTLLCCLEDLFFAYFFVVKNCGKIIISFKIVHCHFFSINQHLNKIICKNFVVFLKQKIITNNSEE